MQSRLNWNTVFNFIELKMQQAVLTPQIFSCEELEPEDYKAYVILIDYIKQKERKNIPFGYSFLEFLKEFIADYDKMNHENKIKSYVSTLAIKTRTPISNLEKMDEFQSITTPKLCALYEKYLIEECGFVIPAGLISRLHDLFRAENKMKQKKYRKTFVSQGQGMNQHLLTEKSILKPMPIFFGLAIENDMQVNWSCIYDAIKQVMGVISSEQLRHFSYQNVPTDDHNALVDYLAERAKSKARNCPIGNEFINALRYFLKQKLREINVIQSHLSVLGPQIHEVILSLSIELKIHDFSRTCALYEKYLVDALHLKIREGFIYQLYYFNEYIACNVKSSQVNQKRKHEADYQETPITDSENKAELLIAPVKKKHKTDVPSTSDDDSLFNLAWAEAIANMPSSDEFCPELAELLLSLPMEKNVEESGEIMPSHSHSKDLLQPAATSLIFDQEPLPMPVVTKERSSRQSTASMSLFAPSSAQRVQSAELQSIESSLILSANRPHESFTQERPEKRYFSSSIFSPASSPFEEKPFEMHTKSNNFLMAPVEKKYKTDEPSPRDDSHLDWVNAILDDLPSSCLRRLND